MLTNLIVKIKALLGLTPSVDLQSMTKAELYQYAESKGVKLPKRINKDQMIHLITKEV